MNKVSIIKYSVAACAFLVAGGLYYSASTTQAGNESSTYSEITNVSTRDNAVTEEITSSSLLYVYICGCVKQPGVYSVDAGTRIFEVIDVAGGLTEEAEASGINQAETVCDGDMIYIPFEGESVNTHIDNEEGSGLVNINTASLEQLMTLQGIGESRATAIVDYREQSGGFTTIEDIMKVSGIKESAFNKIKDYICVK